MTADHVHNFDRVLLGGGMACTICDEVEKSLFELGPFTLPSGVTTHFKIECDVLTGSDWLALARLAVQLLPPFGQVEGVPRGGLAFAKALSVYVTRDHPRLLIADDVWVTGKSMNQHCNNRAAIGIVAFTRSIDMPAWVKPLFYLHPAAEAATYQLNRLPNIIPWV